MKGQKKAFACLAVLGTALLLCGAAWAGRQKETILEFGMITGSNWDVANANSFVIIDQAIERFETEHPGVKIHYYSGVRKDDYSEWFSRKLLAGKEPDVFMVLGTDFNQFSSMGVMKNLEPLMEKDPDFDEEKYFSSSLRSGQYGEVQYALPYETVPTLMFVNKTLLAKEGIAMPNPDWNWDTMYSICQKTTKDLDGDGVLDQFGCYNFGWMDAVYSNGGEIFEADGKESNFTDEKVVESIQFVRRLNDLYQGQKVTQEDFNAGNVVFMPLTFAEYRTYKTYPYKIKRYANFQWDCITMPAGYQGGNLSQVDSLLIGISAHTKHEQLAWEFLKLLTYDEKIQTEIFRSSQGASVLKKVTESKEMESIVQEDMEESDTVISGRLLGRIIEEGQIEPQFKRYEQALALADSEIGQILENDETIDSSLKILQRSVNSYLQQ
ncbi:extracellular solute-binding protein [Clostridiaceae bacterium Marseille-Q4145]|nr:extracellular solute-binding protein [Clostridiaceae bacterium Marseille-Q4145]